MQAIMQLELRGYTDIHEREHRNPKRKETHGYTLVHMYEGNMSHITG